MPPSLEFRVEPFFNNPQRNLLSDGAGSDRDAVRIIVLLGQLGGPFIPTQTTAHALYLVGDNSLPVAAPSEDNTAVGLPVGYGFSCWTDKVRIITGFRGIAAKIDDRMSALFQQFDNGCFERETGMVRAD